jgi:hypothetical protein
MRCMVEIIVSLKETVFALTHLPKAWDR